MENGCKKIDLEIEKPTLMFNGLQFSNQSPVGDITRLNGQVLLTRDFFEMIDKVHLLRDSKKGYVGAGILNINPNRQQTYKIVGSEIFLIKKTDLGRKYAYWRNN